MTIEILYGVRAGSLDEARDKIEAVLKVRLEPGEGLFMGGAYYRNPGAPGTRYFVLRNNVDLDDWEGEFDGLAEPEFPDFQFIIYFDVAHLHGDWQRALTRDPENIIKLRER